MGTLDGEPRSRASGALRDPAGAGDGLRLLEKELDELDFRESAEWATCPLVKRAIATYLPGKHRHDRAILALAIPAVGTLAIDPLVSLVDTAFVGRLGPAELGALGINAAIFAMAFLAFNFLAYGTTPKVAEALGREDRDEVGRIIAQSLWLGLGIGVLASAALLALADPILWAMGATDDLYEPSRTYLLIRALSGPAVLLSLAAHGIYRGIQDTRTPLVVTAILNVINLVLDPLLIFTLGFGIAGAALATLVAQWTGALIFLVLLVRARGELGFSLVGPRLREMLPLLRIGGHLLLRTASLIATMTLATAVAARAGVLAIAAHQVAIQIWGFLALLVDALAVAGQALLARHIGAGRPAEARAIGNRLLQWGLLLGVLFAVAIWLSGATLPRLLTDDPETLAVAVPLMAFVAILQPLNGLVFVWDGLFMGLQKFRFLARAMVAAALIACALLLAVHFLEWGVVGVWWAITALMGVRLLTLAIPWSLLEPPVDRA